MANGQPVTPSIRATTLPPLNSSASRLEPLSNHVAPSENTSGHPEGAPRGTQDDLGLPLSDGTKALLEGQRKDIDRIMASVDNLQQDMKTMKASLDYLKFQQKTFASFAEQEEAKSPTAITEDLQTLTDRISNVTTKVQHVDTLATEVQSLERNVSEVKIKFTEIDSIAENMRQLSKLFSRLDEKANDVGGLKLKLKSMSRRIQRLEDANRERLQSNLASNSEMSSRQNAQRASEATDYDTGVLQEVPSSTRSHSENIAISRRNSDFTVLVGKNEYDSLLDEGRSQQQQLQSQDPLDRKMTPQGNLVDLLQPQITSASKVAAQKRRLSKGSSSPSSSSSSSSSPSHGPRHKRRPVNESTVHGTPNWNTKSKLGSGRRRKLTRLNDPERVLLSDPEDSDFDPSSMPHESLLHHADHHTTTPVRLPTPEWERSDWEGPRPTTFVGNNSNSNNTRGRIPSRRGVSGRGFLPDRNNNTLRRRSGYGDYVSAHSPDYASQPVLDLFAKPRDSKGRLLRTDGKVDGRSLRHRQREAAEANAKAKGKAELQTPLLKLGPLLPQDSNNGDEQVLLPQQQQAPTSQEAQSQTQLRDQGTGYVDAAALHAAGCRVSAADEHQQQQQQQQQEQEPAAARSTDDSNKVKMEEEKGGGGGDTHAKLMSKVFPWR
ncbi:MAG: hypothetical protein L6R35_006536 [Caloplaca aegaea]|nr:MAG: hypothetical protein L6R35_006536 [Caloplaca aegaea]